MWFGSDSITGEGTIMSLELGTKMGTKKGIALAQFGQMLGYPTLGHSEYLERLAFSIESAFPESKKTLQQFTTAMAEKSLGDQEELFTRTFDLAAVCSLYVTGYIFGDENFDRGTLMSILGDRYAELGFNTNGELPDHLSILLVFSSWIDEEALNELIQFCLLQPVTEMVDRLKDSDNPYFFLLSSVLVVLKTDLPRGN
jgi:nitrate reductase molybdenum cofactor assembly chaperone NarJ/NarW